MGFIDSYKRLEKLCGDLLNVNNGITEYINEMEHTAQGAFLVPSWNTDFANLKNYRHIRNQIAHEPNCSEENMCSPEDEKWIEEFYSRIMNRTDPLALYRTEKERHRRIASTPKPVTKNQTFTPPVTPPKQTVNTQNRQMPNNGKNSGNSKIVYVFAVVAILLFLCGIILLIEYFA